jgi:putative CocE/NonD family hydrolase
MDAEFNRLPLNDHPNLKKYAPYYHNWIDHERYDDELWGVLDVSRGYDRITVPAFNIGGWYDIFLGGTLENFTGMRAKGPTPESRQNRLMIGPWNHGGMAAGNPIGEFDFGVRSTGAYIDADELQIAWYDRWLREMDTDLDGQPSVRIFTMGVNEWRHADTWPLPDTDFQDWHFHSRGSANSLRGNGTLSRDEPGSEPPDAFVYNPLNPVPTRGGGLCCNAVWSLGGAYDQRQVEQREDVLVYTSEPLDAPLNVTGPVKVILHAGSSAPDTDWTAKLVDVQPCGYARSLTDGIIRARYRDSMSEPELIEPGAVIEYEIDLWATSNVFRPGHRIRVEISSSNFPRFDRNPNTGELPGRSADVASALQTVHHSSAYPSRIVLPVVPA